jgi:hypothetical protein
MGPRTWHGVGIIASVIGVVWGRQTHTCYTTLDMCWLIVAWACRDDGKEASWPALPKRVSAARQQETSSAQGVCPSLSHLQVADRGAVMRQLAP